VRAAVAPRYTTLTGAFDTTSYLSPDSDIVPLLVLNHQTQMMNLLTELGWETRVAARTLGSEAKAVAGPRVRELVRELADYLLFVDEPPLTSPVRGGTAFARDFQARGPRDSKGRSLRDFDLDRRLLRYPCSYLIYAEAFEALPPAARGAVYERVWSILSGGEQDPVYARLSAADRRAIIDILKDTKKDLPQYFR
jgi:hypothetical protein